MTPPSTTDIPANAGSPSKAERADPRELLKGTTPEHAHRIRVVLSSHMIDAEWAEGYCMDSPCVTAPDLARRLAEAEELLKIALFYMGAPQAPDVESRFRERTNALLRGEVGKG